MTYDLFGLARWNAHSAAKVDAWVVRQETDLTFDMVSLLDDIRPVATLPVPSFTRLQ